MDKGLGYVFDLDPRPSKFYDFWRQVSHYQLPKKKVSHLKDIFCSISHGWEIEIHIIHVILFDFKYIFKVYVTYYLGMLYNM